MNDSLVARPAPGPLRGELRPPGDKSISHRALILSTLAEGQCRIGGLLKAEDIEATAGACRQLGAGFSEDGECLQVKGVGMNGLCAPMAPLDMGNSGTAMRLLAGILAAQPFDSVLMGDESLSRRPMGRIATPLREMGAVVRTRDNGCAPLEIEGGHELRGIRYRSPVASAQIKSCVLLAGLYASGETAVIEPGLSRDHTERMLRAFGVDMTGEAKVRGGTRLEATDLTVPADISSAAFFLAAGALVPESSIRLAQVGLNPTRTGLLQAMRAMGCDIRIENRLNLGEEPAGDVEIRWRPGTQAIDLPPEKVPSMIDELPVLMTLAALAEGTTRIRGAAELRVKESDRIAVMAKGLKGLGFRVRQLADGMDIEGRPVMASPGSQRDTEEPVEVDAAGDHRCAMSLCVLAQSLGRQVRIVGAAQIDTSYPGFVTDLSSLGGLASREGEAARV